MSDFQPSAKIIADSINEQGHRLVTMEVQMHRFVLAEFNTHRSFSRNSASSRAIPFRKMLDRVDNDPALPVHWGKEQKGMQSGESLSQEDIEWCEAEWLSAKAYSADIAVRLHNKGLHKSLCNRILEPWLVHTVICTATEWDNFFWQRCDPAAQPEMRAVADRMQAAYYLSKPRQLAHGEWHLPYTRPEDKIDIFTQSPGTDNEAQEFLKKISVARCARVSYLTQDGKRDIGEDLNLYRRLVGSGHWSPFEHVATPIVGNDPYDCSGNFIGWRQLRKTFRDENRGDFLPNLPELAQVRMRMEAGLNPWA